MEATALGSATPRDDEAGPCERERLQPTNLFQSNLYLVVNERQQQDHSQTFTPQFYRPPTCRAYGQVLS